MKHLLKQSNQVHSPLVIVQEVIIQWYKDTRGSEFARERGKLPRTFDLPDHVPQADPVYLYQTCQPYFRDGVLQVQELLEESDALFQDVSRSIRLEENSDELLVYLHPRGTGMARKKIVLSLGQWLQFRWNRRVPYESTWGYEDRTLNVGFLIRADYSRNYFLSKPPDKSFSELVPLY